MENISSETTQKEIVCKQCSAKLKFKPGTSHLVCEYCGFENEIEIKKEKIEELDFDEWSNKTIEGDDTVEIHVVICNSCGAETTLANDTVSDKCPFCGNLLVITAEAQKKIIKPKSLLPFKIDQRDAFKSYEKWLKKLWWTPPGFKKLAALSEKLNGVYIPYWTYDSQTSTDYEGERGDDYTTTETYTDDNGKSQTRNVTRTRWTKVSGNVNVFFDDVLVVASKSLPTKIVDKLEPWDLKELIPYDESFLSGFRTESYQVNMKDGFEIAKKKMEVIIREQVNKDIGGDKQSIRHMSTSFNEKTFKHTLLPLWISAYRYKNKAYRFLINARTGEVSGERPYCWWKIMLAILLGIGAIALLVYLLG